MKDKEFGYAMKALRMVIRREWHRMTSRRLYLGVCVVLPLFCLFFMATIFGNGQMENIPVGIVDLDNTATSRNISRRISAAPTFRVTEHFTDEADARRAYSEILSGPIQNRPKSAGKRRLRLRRFGKRKV